jgi:hypothetical protein
MPLTELEDRQAAESWSAEEEMVIKTIQQTECVSRPEAIRRMQRRKKASRWAAGGTSPGREGILGSGRRCWNPRCTKGEDGGRGSLAHLRADARYCGAACKKAVQRSLNRQNRVSNRQCLCGFKGGQIGGLVPSHQVNESVRRTGTAGLKGTKAKMVQPRRLAIGGFE